MTKKVGRNDPCPCGSGKKYKRCCLEKDQKADGLFPRDMIDDAKAWIFKKPWLQKEFDEFVPIYATDDILSNKDANCLSDMFLFDYELPDGRTPFGCFIEDSNLPAAKIPIYKDLENNTFSLFKALEVFRGEAIWLRDIVHDGEYLVKDEAVSSAVYQDELLACRIANVMSKFIILFPVSQIYGKIAAHSLYRKVRSMDVIYRKLMDTFDILDILAEHREEMNTLDWCKKALKRKLDSMGLKLDFRGLDRRINGNENMAQAFPDIFGFDFPSNADYEETMNILQALWNKHPRKEFEGRSPEEMDMAGPIEKMLIHTLMDETKTQIAPENYGSAEEAAAAADAFAGELLDKPREELGGKTAAAAISEERIARGNPDRQIRIHLEVTKITDYDINKADKLRVEGLQAFREGRIVAAANSFEEIIRMYPDTYQAWANLGSALASLGNKKRAIECYETALSINPDYEFAKKEMKAVRDLTEEQLTLIGVKTMADGIIARLKEKNK